MIMYKHIMYINNLYKLLEKIKKSIGIDVAENEVIKEVEKIEAAPKTDQKKDNLEKGKSKDNTPKEELKTEKK